MKTHLLRAGLLLVVCPAAAFAAEAVSRPIALSGSGAGAYDRKAIAHMLQSPPDGSARAAVCEDAGDWLEPSEFGKYAAVVLCALDEKLARAWTPEQAQAAERYVREGGHLVFVGTSAYWLGGKRRDLSALAPMVGGGQLVPVKEGEVLLADHPWLAHLKGKAVSPWAWASSDRGLGKITSATALVGRASPSAVAVVAASRCGKGQVSYFAHDYFRLKGEEAEAYAAILRAAIMDARPAMREAAPPPAAVPRASRATGAPAPAAKGAEAWAAVALGPKAPDAAIKDAPVKRELRPTLVARVARGEPVLLVEEGKPLAAVVIGDAPSEAARRGAEELRAAVRKASGAELALFRESDATFTPRSGGGWDIVKGTQRFDFGVLVGETRLGKAAGIPGRELPLEGYVVRTAGNAIFLVGSDLRADTQLPLMGSYFAVVSFLERHLGFRWLWPGELGEVVPKATTLKVGPLDEQDAPAIRRRKMRNYGPPEAEFRGGPAPGEKRSSMAVRTEEGLARLGFTLADMAPWFPESQPWFGRMRLGASYRLETTHSFLGWWDRYGKEHPDWFALQPNGSRAQDGVREQLCTTNPDLIREVVKAKLAEFAADPGMDSVSIAPNDGGKNSFCLCERCRRLDPPNGPQTGLLCFINGKKTTVPYPSLTDRYAAYFAAVAGEVAKAHPGKWISGQAYSAYRDPPLLGKLPSNVLIAIAILNYFDDAQCAVDRRRWEGWVQKVDAIVFRPNLFHSGHGMPAVYVTKLGRDLKRAYQTGMLGTDFDSVIHHWATQGLNYYVCARLNWDPSLDVEVVVRDYCEKGFGPAAPHVRRYFQQLEELTNRLAASTDAADKQALRADEMDTVSSVDRFYDQIPRFYTTEAIAQMKATLEGARAAAAADPEALRRVEFLAAGLRYGEAQAGVFAARAKKGEFDGERTKRLLDERQALFQALFREQPFAVNVAYVAWRERALWTRDFGWNPGGAVGAGKMVK
jgi:antitoxin (DNA-binding transcriptional repressor) of toxin-antitoxin stability system